VIPSINRRNDQDTVQLPTSRESAEQFFLDHLETIEGITRYVCARASLRDADAEDFASFVNLRLVENDYGIVRNFEGRSSAATFLAVVIQRLLFDYRIRQWGRWHPSAEAKRLGAAAVTLERAVYRDGRTPQDALSACQKIDPTMTRERADDLLGRLPRRALRPKPVSLGDMESELCAPEELSADRLLNRIAVARDVSVIVREVLRSMPEHDALLIRLRFGAGMTVADVARTLNCPQFPLYRRLSHTLRELRRRLDGRGIQQGDVEEILSTPDSPLDFGFGDPNSPDASVDSNEGADDEEDEGQDDD